MHCSERTVGKCATCFSQRAQRFAVQVPGEENKATRDSLEVREMLAACVCRAKRNENGLQRLNCRDVAYVFCIDVERKEWKKHVLELSVTIVLSQNPWLNFAAIYA